jgi:hypothetical protein
MNNVNNVLNVKETKEKGIDKILMDNLDVKGTVVRMDSLKAEQ